MRPGRRSAAFVAAAVLTATIAGGCSTEVDPNIPAERAADSTSTTTFAAAGSTEELLDQLLGEAGALSEQIVANEGQRATIGRIDVIWAAARPGVEEIAADSAVEFDRAIALLRIGVDRRRPADADKAYNNLVALVAALT